MRVTDEPGDEQAGVEQDELELFTSLTLDCLALSRAMLEKAPVADDDQLELVRRRRLVQQIERVIRAG